MSVIVLFTRRGADISDDPATSVGSTPSPPQVAMVIHVHVRMHVHDHPQTNVALLEFQIPSFPVQGSHGLDSSKPDGGHSNLRLRAGDHIPKDKYSCREKFSLHLAKDRLHYELTLSLCDGGLGGIKLEYSSKLSITVASIRGHSVTETAVSGSSSFKGDALSPDRA